MGGCVGTSRDGSSSNEDGIDGVVSIGKNQPLKPEKPKWKSDVPLTEGQLRSKRDEFWDTSPAFEGRKEIWDALKAAAHALETHDHALAQAIIDGANISLPNGTLTDCYDELGNRYVLPVYVLSAPCNVIEESVGTDTSTEPETNETIGIEIPLKLRLSSGKDIKLIARSTDTVIKIKKAVEADHGCEASRQRWYVSGKLLHDKLHIEDARIPKGFIIQVILPPEELSIVES